MAVTFPDNPVLNQSYQAENGLTYVWDGEKWSSQGSYNIDNDNYIRKDGTNTVVYADQTHVGIGTTNPTAGTALEVVGVVKVSATGEDDAKIQLDHDGSGNPLVLSQTSAENKIVTSSTLPMLIGPTNATPPLRFQTGGVERMSIRPTGNIGIGYLSSDSVPELLSVNGDTHIEGNLTVTGTSVASGVKVQSSGGFGSSSNRPIACFGGSSDPTSSANSEIKYPAANAPTIQGNGVLKAPGGVLFGNDLEINASGRIRSPYTFSNTSSNTTNLLRCTSSGDFQRSTSSRRYKDNIRNLDEVVGGLDVILSLEPRQWEDHGSGETVTGLIAEEVHEAGAHLGVVWEKWSMSVPHNGTPPVTEDGSVAKEGDLVVDGVNDRGLILHLIEAVRELKAENDALKARLDEAGV